MKAWGQQKMVASTRLYSMHGLLIISPLVGFTREAEWVGDIYQETYFKELVKQLWGWLGIHRARKGGLELWVRGCSCWPQLEFLLRSLSLLLRPFNWLTHTQFLGRSPLMSTDYGLESYLQSIFTIIARFLSDWMTGIVAWPRDYQTLLRKCGKNEVLNERDIIVDTKSESAGHLFWQ